LGQLHLFDLLGTFVFFDAVTGKHLYVNNGTGGTGLNAQRGVFHVGGFFTEDGAQQFFFRRQLGFALRRYLAHQNVARLHFRTDVHNAGFIQLVQGRLAHVRNIGGDFFRTQLGVTRHTGQFLNVDGGQAVFLRHPLRQQNGVFVVVTVPRHEGDAEVLTQGQLTHIHRRTIGHDVATLNLITGFHQRTLVNTGVLVRTGVFGQVVDVHTGFTGHGFIVIYLHHNTGSVDRIDHTTPLGHHAHTGVGRNGTLHTGTHQRLLRLQRRDGLTLHVGTHQGAVGVVVLKERNQ